MTTSICLQFFLFLMLIPSPMLGYHSLTWFHFGNIMRLWSTS
jgi:hypothetical protein